MCLVFNFDLVCMCVSLSVCEKLTKLLEELKQAKETHSPELRHFAKLEHKLHTMELRYNQREEELQQVCESNQ